MATITKEQLFTKRPVKVSPVKLSIGDGFVRQMNGLQKDAFDQTLGFWEDYKDDKGDPKERYIRTMEQFRGKLAVHTFCDKDGNLLLTMDDLPDFMASISGPDLVAIASAAQELNSITDGARKDMVKNLKGGQDAASTSNSVKK